MLIPGHVWQVAVLEVKSRFCCISNLAGEGITCISCIRLLMTAFALVV